MSLLLLFGGTQQSVVPVTSADYGPAVRYRDPRPVRVQTGKPS